MNKSLTYYLTINRAGSIKIRKQKYKLDDDEIGIRLDLKIPSSFSSPRREYVKTAIEIPEKTMPEKETNATLSELNN